MKSAKRTAWRTKAKGFFAGFTALQLVLIVLIFAGGVTIAFLSHAETQTNKFKLFNPEILIEEPGVPDNKSVPWGENAKNVKIRAGNADTSVYVKAALVLEIKDAAGNVFPFDAGVLGAPDPVSGKLTLGDFLFHFDPEWASLWFFKDGYFYYRHCLGAGEETSVLLRGVTFNGDESEREKYANLNINIEVLAGSIQSKNGAAVSAWGVSLESDGVTLCP